MLRNSHEKIVLGGIKQVIGKLFANCAANHYVDSSNFLGDSTTCHKEFQEQQLLQWERHKF